MMISLKTTRLKQPQEESETICWGGDEFAILLCVFTSYLI